MCPCSAWRSQSGHHPVFLETGLPNVWEVKCVVRHDQGINKDQRIGPKNKEKEVCGDPGTKEQIKPRRVLECRNRKTRPLSPSLPHVVTINEFQVLLSSITCLPSYPIGRRYLPYSSPHPVYVPHAISKWPTRPLSHSLYPGYKSGLRTLHSH